jgi:hypothetical protein
LLVMRKLTSPVLIRSTLRGGFDSLYGSKNIINRSIKYFTNKRGYDSFCA